MLTGRCITTHVVYVFERLCCVFVQNYHFLTLDENHSIYLFFSFLQALARNM